MIENAKQARQAKIAKMLEILAIFACFARFAFSLDYSGFDFHPSCLRKRHALTPTSKTAKQTRASGCGQSVYFVCFVFSLLLGLKSRSMELLLGKTEEELIEFAKALGEAPFRGKQLYQAIYSRRLLDPSQMTELSKDLREKLLATARIAETTIENVFYSTDGARRYLLRLGDGREIETVFMPEDRRDTICISCQVGCAVGCEFCMTAQIGIKRNMTAGEIISQVIIVLNEVYGAGADLPHGTNLVFMGMGESFLNYEEVMKSIRMMADKNGLGIGPKRMTVSTSGITPRIYDFAREPIRPHLAISLSATTEQQRNDLMPINRKYTLEELMKACRQYPLDERERLTFEYVMLDGVNDSDEDARRLVKLLNGIRAKVNLIPHNPAPELPHRASPMERILGFQKILVDKGVPAFIRRPRGQDISAACGQLAARHQATGLSAED
jgi:23S rRNA (adenine2503-C2)-methyltransferase